MKEMQPGSRHTGHSVETEIVATCEETIATVHMAVRTMQAAALDVRDAVIALQRLHTAIEAETLQPGARQALRSALEQGLALVRSFDAMGIYNPVPIELLR